MVRLYQRQVGDDLWPFLPCSTEIRAREKKGEKGERKRFEQLVSPQLSGTSQLIWRKLEGINQDKNILNRC